MLEFKIKLKKKLKRKIQMERDIDFYINQIKSYPLLTQDEENEIVKRKESGDEEALEILIQSNLRFVITLVKKFKYSLLEFNDLIQVGNIGLIEAAKRFSLNHGAKFSTFAKYYINKYLYDYAYKMRYKVTVPKDTYLRCMRLLRKNNRGEKVTFKKKTIRGVSSMQEVNDVVCMENLSLDIISPFANNDDLSHDSLYKIISDDRENTPDNILIKKENRGLLLQALKNLSDKEKTVINGIFGLQNEKKLSFYALGDKLNMSHESARSIYKNTIAKLKRIFAEDSYVYKK